jgi:hypothetical protein
MASILKFDQWQNTAGNTYGTVLQVVQTVKADTWSSSSDGTSFYPVTGLTVSITPKFVTSKVLVMVNVHASSGYWEIQGRITRNGGDLTGSWGNARGSRTRATFMDNRYENVGSQRYGWGILYSQYLDSPATASSTTYGLSLNGYSTFTLGVNYNAYSDSDSADYFANPISTITVMEIAA